MGQLMESLIRNLRSFLDFACWIYGCIFWREQKNKVPAITDRILLKPATELAELIRGGKVSYNLVTLFQSHHDLKLSAEDVMRSYIKRILDINPIINAVVDERFEDAIEDAIKVDERVERELNGEKPPSGTPSIHDQLLLGVPFSCKDSFAIKDMVFAGGLVQRKHVKAAEDAVCISNMRKAGAIPVTIDNVPVALMWWTAENKAFGRTNNPYDLSRISGGSGGGSCALVSSAGAILAVGSDIGGSIRIPCFMNGVFGHKSSTGVVSPDGKYPPFNDAKMRYWAGGPVTRFACDLKPMLKALAGERIKLLPKIDEPSNFSNVTIYYLLDDEDPIKTRVISATKENILKIVSHFEAKFGCKSQEVKFPEFSKTTPMFLSAMKAAGGPSFAATLNDGRGNQKSEINIYWELIKNCFGFSDFTRHALVYALMDKNVPDKDSNFCKTYLKMRDELIEKVNKLLGKNNVLLMPSYPDTAPKHGTTIPKVSNVGYFSILNLLSLPATQIPTGMAEDGLPLGVQIATGHLSDHISLNMAVEIEKMFGGWVPPSPFLNHDVVLPPVG